MSFHSVLIVQLGDHDEIRLCHLPIFPLRQRAIRDELRRFDFKLLPVVSMVNTLLDEGKALRFGGGRLELGSERNSESAKLGIQAPRSSLLIPTFTAKYHEKF